MIEKRIRYFDEGGSSDSGGSDSSGSDSTSDSTPAYSPAADSQAAYVADTPADNTVDGYADVGATPAPYSPAADSQAAYAPEDAPAMPRYSPAQDSADAYSTWDNAKAYLSPYTGVLSGLASLAFPALRAPMMIANAAQSINNDPSASNIARTLLAAPVAKATGLNTGAVSSLFGGDIGGAVGNQVVGTAMGDVNRAIGVDAAKALGLANAATGFTGDAKQSIASAINNALNDRSTSVTQAQGLSPADAAKALEGRGGDTGVLASAPTYVSHSNPVTSSISNILGVKPMVARGKNVPVDIVQQLMAMQNQPGNLESVPASTGGSIDDLIRLTRS